MSTFQEYISVIGFCQGGVLFILLIADSRMTTSSRILGLICLMIALAFLMPFLLENSTNSAVSWAIGIVFYLTAITAPLGYLYCRTVLLQTPLMWRDLIHGVPIAICVILTADVSIADPQEMARWITGARPHTLRLQFSEYVPVIMAYAYAIFNWYLIWRYRLQAHDNLANFNPAVFNWLLSLQVLSLVVRFLKTLSGFTSYNPTLLNDIANLFLIGVVYLIAVKQWRNPQFFAIPGLTEERPKISTNNADEGVFPQDGELDSAIRAKLFEGLEVQMEKDELYRSNSLSLTELSTLTGLSKHHLSEVLNRHAGKNFYEFINSYRVVYAKKRLENLTDETVLEIAFEAGFSSKSTFNAIFKKFTGQTPTQYRRAYGKPRQ